MMKIRGIWIIALIFFASTLTAQQGRVRVTGKVTDGETGEALPGANVIVKGTTIGTISELNGDYNIMVPGEESVLVYSFLGYTSQEVTIGDQRNINIELSMDMEILEEVVVTAQAKGQIGARRQQINSVTVKNVVSKDRLQENPDANAVEAIGRLPGISVIRSGGEGSQIVIRGLEPRYTNVTIDGVKLPSSSHTGRGAEIGGISQYVLQGVEVYKALTPDLEANAVGGTVNLKLQETPAGLHYNVMAQGGYNNQNDFFGNYKLMGEVSNRFLDDKLGVSLTASAERVNRGVHTMSAAYDYESIESDLYITETILNLVNRLNYRQSATLALDYRLGQSTKLKLYGMYSHSGINSNTQTKSYGFKSTLNVWWRAADSPNNNTNMYLTTLSGETNLDFLNMNLRYGVAMSKNRHGNPHQRSWNYQFVNASSDSLITLDNRVKDPQELLPLFNDSEDSLHNTISHFFTDTDTEQEDQNLSGHLDVEIPFQIGDLVTGSVKFGGKYRVKERYLDITQGSQIVHPFTEEYWFEDLDWLQQTSGGWGYTLEGFEDHMVDDFLGGDYDYGLYLDFDRLNATSDFWDNWSDSVYQLGQTHWLSLVNDISLLSYSQSLEASMIHDQKITEHYYAGYAMTELNFGQKVMFMPGFRYEATDAEMGGFVAMEPQYLPPVIMPLVGSDTSDTRSDRFFLPMAHLRIKPTKSMYMHMSYTQTISRPDFNAISPNYYFNPGKSPFKYHYQNPDLRTELWTNFDGQVTFHGTKIGLLSVSGFYKTVEDKIWYRVYNRLRGDDPVPNFDENSVVELALWENHEHDIFLKGVEFEWQTSFWYLPGFLKYFTMNLNYTLTDSETKYNYSFIKSVIPPEGGRPVPMRIDTVLTGPMLYQPKHIVNASLGFNYKGFNTWLSFQYNGMTNTHKDPKADAKDHLTEHFYRMDFQITYDIPLSLPGKMQVMGNFANLTNYEEVKRLRGDPRYTYREAYGWTVDLGVRYSF
ncbi:MAG: TonB-dependent receptor [Bacteroidota bacterium]